MLKLHLKIIIFFFLCLQPMICLEANAITHDWLEVPKSEYGIQVWDKLSFQRNNDGSIRVLSKFIPNTDNNITSNILYKMDIKCSDKTFRDISVGQDNFNEYNNPNTDWKDPNGDVLILGVIDQVCNFKK